MNSLSEFVDYVWSFYGSDDPLYPIAGLTKKDIVDAFNIYVERIEKGDLEYVHYSWGDGVHGNFYIYCRSRGTKRR